MVVIDGQKYACTRCIRGHRVSTCNHEGPLIHIKPKGRPATQCKHCRESRKSASVHVKCVCGASGETSCKCQITNKCMCPSKSKAATSSESPPPMVGQTTGQTQFPGSKQQSQGSITQPKMQPTPPEEGIEMHLGKAANPNQSPFHSWYPNAAEAYNRLPDEMPTFDYEDDTAPLSSATEFVRLQMTRSRSASELKNLAYSTQRPLMYVASSSKLYTPPTQVISPGKGEDHHHLAMKMQAQGKGFDLNSWY